MCISLPASEILTCPEIADYNVCKLSRVGELTNTAAGDAEVFPFRLSTAAGKFSHLDSLLLRVNISSPNIYAHFGYVAQLAGSVMNPNQETLYTPPGILWMEYPAYKESNHWIS
jgi:hypothetical protein